MERYPELRAVLGKIDAEEQPARYAAFIAKAGLLRGGRRRKAASAGGFPLGAESGLDEFY